MGRPIYLGPRLGAPWEIDARLREIGEFVRQRDGEAVAQRGDAARAFRWSTCLHEAGHVLAAKSYGITVKKVVVGRGLPNNPGWGGYITTEGGSAWAGGAQRVRSRR